MAFIPAGAVAPLLRRHHHRHHAPRFHARPLLRPALALPARTLPARISPARRHTQCMSDTPPDEVNARLSNFGDPLVEPPPSPVVEAAAEVAGDTVAAETLDERTEAQKEAERLRAAERFIEIDEGNYECKACGYLYEQAKGERMSGVEEGTPFDQLSPAFVCPVCRSPKAAFVSKKKVIAGFADNQSYGFGSNGLTGGQKSALIYGTLLALFLLLLSGYALN